MINLKYFNKSFSNILYKKTQIFYIYIINLKNEGLLDFARYRQEMESVLTYFFIFYCFNIFIIYVCKKSF